MALGRAENHCKTTNCMPNQALKSLRMTWGSSDLFFSIAQDIAKCHSRFSNHVLLSILWLEKMSRLRLDTGQVVITPGFRNPYLKSNSATTMWWKLENKLNKATFYALAFASGEMESLSPSSFSASTSSL